MKEQEKKCTRMTITSVSTVELFHNYTLIRPIQTESTLLYGFQPKSQLLALYFSKTLLTFNMFERNVET